MDSQGGLIYKLAALTSTLRVVLRRAISGVLDGVGFVRSEKYLIEFCIANNLNLDFLRGEKIPGHGSIVKTDPYEIMVGLFSCFVPQQRITALKIKRPHRFSNSLVQLANAIDLAESIGVKRIYASGFWYVKRCVTSSGIEIIPKKVPSLFFERLVIEGYFYYSDSLGEISGKTPSRYRALSTINDYSIAEISYLTEKDLVIHVRSGDIFTGDGVHPDYGQPPLAFYKMACGAKDWRSVYLVAEDELNPVIDALRDWFEGSGKSDKLKKRIGCSLESDVAFLMSAKVLVCGVGTFCEGIVAISKSIKWVITYNNAFDAWGRGDLLLTTINDGAGLYNRVMGKGLWRNTAEQHRFMLDYPEGNLVRLGVKWC